MVNLTAHIGIPNVGGSNGFIKAGAITHVFVRATSTANQMPASLSIGMFACWNVVFAQLSFIAAFHVVFVWHIYHSVGRFSHSDL